MSVYNTGAGGTLLIGVVNLPISKWECNLKSKLAENNHSGVTTGSNYEHVRDDPDWTAEGAVDEDVLPDTDAGATNGSKVLATFKNGADARTIILTNTTVENIVYTCDGNDIVRFRASGKGGTVTRMAT